MGAERIGGGLISGWRELEWDIFPEIDSGHIRGSAYARTATLWGRHLPNGVHWDRVDRECGVELKHMLNNETDLFRSFVASTLLWNAIS